MIVFLTLAAAFTVFAAVVWVADWLTEVYERGRQVLDDEHQHE